MGKGIFSPQIHSRIQFFSFALIAIGMPSTKILMSLGLIVAIANWILENGFSEKWRTIRSNRLLQLLIGFYLLLIVGLIWSWDVTQGLKDIKSRLPMLALPLIMATSPKIDKKHIHTLLQFFLASLFVTSLFNVLYFNNVIGNYEADDIRGLSRFASHIRYGLLISIGFGICAWFQLTTKKFNPIYSLLGIWFAFYTVYSQVLSGVFTLTLVAVTLIFFLLYQWKRIIAFSFLGLLFGGISWISLTLLNLSHETINCDKLPAFTEQGYPYDHHCETTTYSEINGKAILVYYSELEMFLEWKKVSDMDFMLSDKKGSMLRMTAARYMTSIGLTKDAKGIRQLTPEDIRNIEDGYCYPNQRNEIILPRLYGIKYQLLNRQNPNGHSLLQRIEHWKTSVYIIQNNWLTGVGTGGNQKAFDKAYEETNSLLNTENRVRSHNMYLTYTISYGIVGGMFFLVLLAGIFYRSWKTKNLLSLLFLMIACGSFLVEDTLETQLGVTFFGFFLSLLFACEKQEQME